MDIAVSAPRAWNGLSLEKRGMADEPLFKTLLKTMLFRETYSAHLQD